MADEWGNYNKNAGPDNNNKGRESGERLNANGGWNDLGSNPDFAYQTVMKDGSPKTKGWSVASLICGILSLICCCLGLASVIFGILAIVFAVISRRNMNYFDGMSVAGLILGIFGIVMGVAMMIVIITPEFWDAFNEAFQEGIEQGGGFGSDVNDGF